MGLRHSQRFVRALSLHLSIPYRLYSLYALHMQKAGLSDMLKA